MGDDDCALPAAPPAPSVAHVFAPAHARALFETLRIDAADDAVYVQARPGRLQEAPAAVWAGRGALEALRPEMGRVCRRFAEWAVDAICDTRW